MSDESALPHQVHSGGRLFDLIKLTSVTMSSHLLLSQNLRVAMHPKIDSCTTKGSIIFRVLHDPSDSTCTNNNNSATVSARAALLPPKIKL